MKIAISSLIKNELKFLPKYLERNKDADYICLLDTGSTDGTWEYLQKEAKNNPKLIIDQKIYNDFRFDIARNDSIDLIPDDVDIIVILDLDEYFSDSNWREIIENNIKPDKNVVIYSTFYKDGSTYNTVEGMARMFVNPRIIQTKKIKYYYCVHEAISDNTWDILGYKNKPVVWNKLLIIHEPDINKSRTSYISLCQKRCYEVLENVKYDTEYSDLNSKCLLLFEYYRNYLYDYAINLYNEILLSNNKHKNIFINDLAIYMYKMTNDINYIRKVIMSLKEYIYNQELLYFALKDDLEWCKQYKDDILKKIEEHNNELEDRFKKYDILGNKIKEMSCEL